MTWSNKTKYDKKDDIGLFLFVSIPFMSIIIIGAVAFVLAGDEQPERYYAIAELQNLIIIIMTIGLLVFLFGLVIEPKVVLVLMLSFMLGCIIIMVVIDYDLSSVGYEINNCESLLDSHEINMDDCLKMIMEDPDITRQEIINELSP